MALSDSDINNNIGTAGVDGVNCFLLILLLCILDWTVKVGNCFKYIPVSPVIYVDLGARHATCCHVAVL